MHDRPSTQQVRACGTSAPRRTPACSSSRSFLSGARPLAASAARSSHSSAFSTSACVHRRNGFESIWAQGNRRCITGQCDESALTHRTCSTFNQTCLAAVTTLPSDWVREGILYYFWVLGGHLDRGALRHKGGQRLRLARQLLQLSQLRAHRQRSPRARLPVRERRERRCQRRNLWHVHLQRRRLRPQAPAPGPEEMRSAAMHVHSFEPCIITMRESSNLLSLSNRT